MNAMERTLTDFYGQVRTMLLNGVSVLVRSRP